MVCDTGGAAKLTDTMTSVYRSNRSLTAGLQRHSRSPMVAGRYAFFAVGSISRSPSGEVDPLSATSGLWSLSAVRIRNVRELLTTVNRTFAADVDSVRRIG